MAEPVWPSELTRVLLALHLDEHSGPSRSLEGAMRWIAERAEVDVMVPDADGPVGAAYSEFANVEAAGFEAMTIQGGPLAMARRASRIRAGVRDLRIRLQARRPDVVIQATTLLPAVTLAARREGVPLVIHAGELFPRSGLRALAGRAAVRFATADAAAIVACSAPVAGQFRHSRRPVEIILPPIDRAYAGGDRDASRAKFGLGSSDEVVIAAGSISRGRGQDTLVRAMRIVARERPAARCLIFGVPHPRPQDRRFETELRDLIGAEGLEEKVMLVGATADMPGAYAAADVVVNPARVEEAFGRVAFEAAIAGRPVVSTAVGAVPEYLEDERSALLVPPDDPARLARAIAALLGDPENGRRLAASAAERARREMTQAEAIRSLVRLLGQVA